jgi:hypothetical protein
LAPRRRCRHDRPLHLGDVEIRTALDTATLDEELRAILREEVAFPEHVEIEFERIRRLR